MFNKNTWDSFRRAAWNLQLHGNFYSSAWNTLFDTHPTERQYDFQQWLAGTDPTGLYGQYMVNKSTIERNKEIMQYYGLDFNDFKYPWLASLSKTQSSAYAPTAQFISKNIHRLYR